MEQAAVIDVLESDRGDEGEEGGWDLLRAARPTPDVALSEQKVLFRHMS